MRKRCWRRSRDSAGCCYVENPTGFHGLGTDVALQNAKRWFSKFALYGVGACIHGLARDHFFEIASSLSLSLEMVAGVSNVQIRSTPEPDCDVEGEVITQDAWSVSCRYSAHQPATDIVLVHPSSSFPRLQDTHPNGSKTTLLTLCCTVNRGSFPESISDIREGTWAPLAGLERNGLFESSGRIGADGFQNSRSPILPLAIPIPMKGQAVAALVYI